MDLDSDRWGAPRETPWHELWECCQGIVWVTPSPISFTSHRWGTINKDSQNKGSEKGCDNVASSACSSRTVGGNTVCQDEDSVRDAHSRLMITVSTVQSADFIMWGNQRVNHLPNIRQAKIRGVKLPRVLANMPARGRAKVMAKERRATVRTAKPVQPCLQQQPPRRHQPSRSLRWTEPRSWNHGKDSAHFARKLCVVYVNLFEVECPDPCYPYFFHHKLTKFWLCHCGYWTVQDHVYQTTWRHRCCPWHRILETLPG